MTQRIIKPIVLLFAITFSFAGAPEAHSQNQEVQYEKAFISQSLSGAIRSGLGEGAGVKGVLVEEMNADWKTTIQNTRTDENGHFSLASRARSKVHYLRLSANGFDITYLKVRISSRAREKELSLHITVAT